ncbi:MAG: helix-turn-helix transcriptional regulator [Chthoniobacterales bacterium]
MGTASSRGAVNKRFAENLRRIRENRGLSQEALADLSGIHRTEASLLERGKREPRLGTLVKLAGALEVTVEELAEGIEWWPTENVSSSSPGGFRIESERH